MTVTAQLIGKLGGGKPETAVVKVAGSGVYEPPAGWRKAAGVFEGRSTKDTYRVFDQSYTAYFSSVSVNGGGVVTGGSSFQNVSGTITWVRLE